MKLIDADEFIQDECNHCDGACESLPCDCLECKADCRCDFIKDLESAPTIDAVPVKHGEWSTYDVSGYRKCSMCGGYVNWNPKPFLFGDGEYNFCPNCGAKMDGGRDDV